MTNVNTIDAANDVSEANNALKRDLTLLQQLDAAAAAAAITYKMVDAVDAITNKEIGKAASDLWSCGAAIQGLVYESMAEKYETTSDHGVAAKVANAEARFEEARRLYIVASTEVCKGTVYEEFFTHLR